MACADYAVAIEFGQTINIVVVFGFQTKVLSQVDNAHVGRHVMLGEETCAFAVSEAEKEHVNLFDGQLVGEAEVCFAIESLVDIGNVVAGIAFAVYENDFGFRVIKQNATKFAGGVTGTTYNSYFNHIGSFKRDAACTSGTRHGSVSIGSD